MINDLNYAQQCDPIKESQKAAFMEHMYNCDGRNNPSHPMHSLFTGLWQKFCIEEAGPVLRNQYFDFLEAVKEYEEATTKQLNQ